VYRYLALIWNPADQQASSAALLLAQRLQSASAQWGRALDAQGLAIFHAGLGEGASQTRLFHHGAGCVLGRAFSRNLQTRISALRVDFDIVETTEIIHTGGRRLFERYWGRYVAVVHDAATGETWVLRDPTGGLPCLLMTYRGVNIVFSDLQDCLKLGLPGFSVNWRYVAGVVAHSSLQVRETGLNEVSEVQPGERVRFSGDSISRSIEWNPIAIAQTDPIHHPDEAVAALRSTARACIHAWASCYSGLVHNLSGGLDSSIVLSCLMDAPSRPAVTCLHYFGTGPDEDERKYARLVAQHAHAELVEHQLDPSELKLEEILNLKRSAKPWFYMYELEHGQAEAHLAAQKGANGLFSGAGGDGVFFQARADLAVTDYLFDHGFGRGLLRVAVDAARISRKSIWPLLFKALQTRLISGQWNPMEQAGHPPRTLINQRVLRSAKRDRGFVHPWLTRAATRGVPPGILWHVTSVAVPPAYYNSFGPEANPERTLPLLSQPLIELCLRIPTYVLIKSGRDRAMARRAFASDLPEEIIRRRAKGRIDQHVRNIVDANIGFVREFLLDGILVREGLLDRKNLELYLTRERSPADFQYNEILQEHVSIEAWLKRSLEPIAAQT
jgi:asparagine synthase (glutamine-hydrolysing)